ncbi:MAG: hypothetical protein ABSD61_05265 [Terracidiphilus sp.]|jgi:hypothetical protein
MDFFLPVQVLSSLFWGLFLRYLDKAYRFLAIREPLRRLPLGDQAQLPFPTQEFGHKGTYKLFGVVTNRKDAGDQVICWLRERCGKSEEVHSVMTSDLAGGRLPCGLLPCGLFGANAAWWALMILAHNLNTAMKRLVLGNGWLPKRMKALRLRLTWVRGHGAYLAVRGRAKSLI